ncbi:MAG: DUF349 domain-containing protein [Caldimonas sp.]
MLDWIKKNKAPGSERAEGSAAEPPAGADAAQAEADAVAAIDWEQRLRAAIGDDTALLGLAREGAPVDVKVAAVAALASEAALKIAEREHRDRDRRVHRLAKQRYLAQVASRETREHARLLIEAAQALVDQPLVPANRLVELHRAWQALDLTLLDAAQRAEFDALLTRLAALTRERGDHTLKLERWTAEARQALARLHAACAAAAAGTHDRAHLGAAGAAAQAVLEAAPIEDASAALRDSLQTALQGCARLDERLAVLDELLQPAPADGPAAAPEPAAGDAVAEPTAPPRDPASRWLELAPLADAGLAEALALRFEQWRQAREQAREAHRAERRERARERERERRTERTGSLATALEQAEAALSAGHLADTHKHLVEIDELVHGGASATALRSRIEAVQGEYTRLKGWQHWGGGVARDDLVLQAEALAAATLGEPGAKIVKLSIRQQAEVIDDLRARWKELDRLGGATSRSLWQRFDAALKAAYRPVAAHLDVQRAARLQNLQARDQLVAALNAVALPDPDSGSAPDWKALAAALERFHGDWRRLGPLEHTVPHKERDKLLERMGAAVQRLEAPLNEARRGAQAERERLVAAAQALAAEASVGAGARGREWIGRARDLQAEWQRQAAALPLARAVEKALWSRFKADIDAVFNARDAAFNARDAEFKAHGAERAALIERLTALPDDTPPAELKRMLAEVDARWQRAGPAPRGDAAALDSRFRSARDAARQLLATHAQRSWHSVCDALAAKLALCEELEDSVDAAEAKAAIGQRWAEQPALPPAWEQALARRASSTGAASGGGVRGTASIDDLLLQLEAAFQLESPPDFAAARRELKLRALKAALEGRQPAGPAPLAPDELLAAALGRAALAAVQRERLRRVIAALRDRGPTGAG